MDNMETLEATGNQTRVRIPRLHQDLDPDPDLDLDPDPDPDPDPDLDPDPDPDPETDRHLLTPPLVETLRDRVP